MLAVLTAPAIGRRVDSTSLLPLTSSAEPMDPPHRLLIEQSLPARYSEWVVETLEEIEGFLITDPGIADHPIVFASHGFLVMSGYSIEERPDLQGPDTDRRSVMEIREAIREERMLQISLLNYRKDGTPHWILFHLFPVFRVEDIRVAHFVAVQVEIPMRSRCLRSSAEHRHGGGTGRLLVACRNECQSDYKLGCDTVVESFVDADIGGATETGLIPSFMGMPIVYASDEFLSLSGYSRHEVLGCDCWFLNGPDTDADAIHQISQSIQAERSCTIRLLNYRKDRSFFWNLHHISPIRNSSGKDCILC